MIKVLITAPARQDPKIFKEYRESIANLIIPNGVFVDNYYVVNNCPELIPYLYSSDKYDVVDTNEAYYKTHNDHIWTRSNMVTMETLRNKTIQYALENGYDYWFSVDTDLVLHPETLRVLLQADKDIVSEIFWSVSKDTIHWCNAWMYDNISGSPSEWNIPGLYQCGMTGACMLVKRHVLESGVNYTHIPNIRDALIGEDRHFCVRAAVHGFEFWVDTHFPATHLYTNREYVKYMSQKGDYFMSERKVLDIVITHYNESWKLVEPCLMILKLQKCVDFNKFRVTVIHDGAEKFEELKDVEFPFEFREICIPHGGVSAARNKGIDLADAEWITFIDCDDCYSDVYSLGFIMPSLENDDQFNLLWSKFYITRDVNVEAMPDSTKEIDWIWMANKYYRTDFLKERGIRFLEGLDYAEDSAFNNWVRFELKDEECGEILTPAPLYAWCRRKGSATTSSGNLLRNAMHILKRNIYVSDMYKHYGREATGLMMARTITDGYSAVMSIILNNNHKAKEEYIKQLKEFYNENRDLIDKVTPDEWQYVLDASTENKYSGYKYISEMQPFEEWFKKVIKE